MSPYMIPKATNNVAAVTFCVVECPIKLENNLQTVCLEYDHIKVHKKINVINSMELIPIVVFKFSTANILRV